MSDAFGEGWPACQPVQLAPDGDVARAERAERAVVDERASRRPDLHAQLVGAPGDAGEQEAIAVAAVGAGGALQLEARRGDDESVELRREEVEMRDVQLDRTVEVAVPLIVRAEHERDELVSRVEQRAETLHRAGVRVDDDERAAAAVVLPPSLSVIVSENG